MVMEGDAHVAPPTLGVSSQDTKFTYRPPIRPYLTSTPNDFNAEREFLMRTVFPVLDEVCKERGTYFSAVDLRWTARDKYAQDGNVLELSLDKIAQSSPFFICLLGDCYGYHRPENAPPLPKLYDDLQDDCDWVDKNFMIADTGGYHWVLKDGRQLCSLTEIEIIEAAFFTDDEYCFFYFRQPEHVDGLYQDLPKVEREEKLQVFQSESEYANLKIRDLKSRIVKKGLSVKYFRTLEDLANVVSEDWMEIINTLYPPLPRALIEKDSEEFHEIISNEAFIAQSRTQNFVCTPKMDDVMAEITHFASTAHNDHAINEELENILNLSKFSYATKMRKDKPIEIKYKSLLVLAGPRGYGKSTMVVNWLNDFIDEYHDIKVISLLVGSSLASFDIAAFMRRATRELKREFMPEFTDEDLQKTWQADDLENFSLTCETLMAAVSLGPCVLVIDGVDELRGTCGLTQKQIKEMDWLPLPLPPQVKVIMTTSSTDLSFKSLSIRRDADIITLPLFKERPQRLKLTQEFMTNMYSKHLPKRAFKAILDCKHANRPMYLHALAGEFRLYQVYTLIEHYLETYLEISSLRDLWAKIIQRWIAEYSWTSEPAPNTEMALTLTQQPEFEYAGWIADALRLLAVSRQGLTEAEILACLRQLGYYGDSAITSLDWAIFRNAAFGMLIERPGGLLNYFHHHCKEAVEYALLGTVIPSGDANTKLSLTNSWNLDKQRYHGYLAAFFLAQPHSIRRSDELPYHMEHNGDMGGLCSVVSDPKIFLSMYADPQNRQRQLDLLHYWHLLQQFGYNVANVYIEMVEGREPATSETQDAVMLEDTAPSDDVSRLVGPKGQGLPTIIMTRALSHDLSVIEEGGSVEGSNIKSSDHGSEHNPGSDDVSVQEDGQTFLTDVQEEEDHASDPPHQQAFLAYHVGLFLSQLGFGDEAVGMLLNAHKCLNDNYPLDFESSSLHCEVQETLGNLFAKYENQGAAIYWLKKALNTISDILISSEIDGQLTKVIERKGHIMDELGYHCLTSARLQKADDLLTGALECMDEVGSVTGRASVHHHMGRLKFYQQEYLKAEGCYRYSLMMREQWYGKKHTMVSKVLQDLAALLCMKENAQGFNRDEAETLFRRALDIRERSLGDGHVLVAETLASLGELMNRSGSLSAKSEAKLLLQRALDVKTTKLGPNHPSTRLVRKELNDTGITLKLGLYDYGPAKPTDKRTMDFPCSSMSWRENDLTSLSFMEGGRSKSRLSKYSKSPGPSGTPSGMWMTSKYRMETPTEPAAKPDQNEGTYGEELEAVSDKEKALSRGVHSGKASQMSNRSYTEDLMKLLDSKKMLCRPTSPVAGDRQSPGFSEKQRLLKRDALPVRMRYPDPEDELSVNTGRLSLPRSVTPSSKKVTLGVAPTINVKSPSTENSDIPHYVESYASEFQTQKSGKHSQKNVRPKSAPESYYAEYFSGAPVKAIPRTFISPTPMRPRSLSARINSAHSLCSSHGTSKSFESAAIHGMHCRIPGAHTIDTSNAMTIQGPHSSIKSLMGPPACPRDNSLKVRHYSTWFQVPGRYPTVSKPYPPKRSHLVKRVRVIKRGGSAPSGGMKRTDAPLQSKTELNVTFKEEEEARPVTSHC